MIQSPFYPPRRILEGGDSWQTLALTCDVAIVGSGFAGSLIAKELSQKPIDTPNGKRRLNVVILEAGPGVQPNINGYMKSFYKANAKVPESPYPPALGPSAPSATVAAGRPSLS